MRVIRLEADGASCAWMESIGSRKGRLQDALNCCSQSVPTTQPDQLASWRSFFHKSRTKQTLLNTEITPEKETRFIKLDLRNPTINLSNIQSFRIEVCKVESLRLFQLIGKPKTLQPPCTPPQKRTNTQNQNAWHLPRLPWHAASSP